MFEIIKNNKFNICLALLYLIITVFTAFHHELWLDEATAWCLVRDCPLNEIIPSLKVEGHPFLWYALLLPFAKSGCSVYVMQTLALFVLLSAILVFIFKAPFNKFEKLITVFSAGMLYYLPVVARNYALIPVVLFLIATTWNKKYEHPVIFALLIFLLSQTHLYIEGLAFVLFLFFSAGLIKNGEKLGKPLKIILILLLFVNFAGIFLFYLPSPELNNAVAIQKSESMSFHKMFFILQRIFVFPAVSHFSLLIKYSLFIEILSLYIPFGIILYSFFKRSKKIFSIYCVSCGYILFVFSKVWFNGILYQKAFLLVLITVFCVWVIKNEFKDTDKPCNYTLNFILIISFICSPFVIIDEIKYPFSSGKLTAEYIKQNLNDEDIFIAMGNPNAYASVSAYLPDKKLYSPIIGNYISNYDFNIGKQNENVEFPESAKYFIVDENVDNIEETGFKTIYRINKKVITKERLRICTE